MKRTNRMARTVRSVTSTAFLLVLVAASSAVAARGVRASAAQSVGGGARYGGAAVYAAPRARAAVAYGYDVDRNVGLDRRDYGDVEVRRDLVDPDYGVRRHPVAAAAAVAATVAVVGSLYYELPAGCVTVVVDNYAYQQCGDTWFEPVITEYETYYYVVEPPE